MKAILTGSNRPYLFVVEIRPVRDLNSRTLRYQCGAPPTELKSRPEAGHYDDQYAPEFFSSLTDVGFTTARNAFMHFMKPEYAYMIFIYSNFTKWQYV